MKSISVIIVSWNACAYLRDCLVSIRETSLSCVLEIFVVDNASEDGSPSMVEREFPEVNLIRANHNLGFARANNLAIKQAKGSLLALVNSDVIVHPNCFEHLAAFMVQHNDVGLAGPRIMGGDGNLQKSCRRLPGIWNTICRILALDKLWSGNPIFSGFEMPEQYHDQQREAEVLSGCFWMARKSAVDEIGGLDEQFFFYGEDIDWCKRFCKAGWKLMFVPEATATHYGGGSTANAPLRYSIEILRATLKYWHKHHGVAGQIVCYFLLLVHHGFRLPIHWMAQYLIIIPSTQSIYKLKQDLVCLRWLLTGKELESSLIHKANQVTNSSYDTTS